VLRASSGSPCGGDELPRLLTSSSTLEAVNSRSWLEGDFEELVVSLSPEIFPRWTCVPFSETVEGDDGTRKQPDLALIDLHYREWWVVEVELAHHDLRGHILPQVQAFQTGSYGDTHARALHRAQPSLDLDRLKAMMLGEPPKVIVIADSPSVVAEWQQPLRAISVRLGIAEPFRSRGLELILRLNGDQPEPPGESLTRCSRLPNIRRMWKVHSPASLPPEVEVLRIDFAGVTSPWARVNIQDGVLLKPVGGDVLEDLALVDLVQREDGSLAFEEVVTTRRRRRSP